MIFATVDRRWRWVDSLLVKRSILRQIIGVCACYKIVILAKHKKLLFRLRFSLYILDYGVAPLMNWDNLDFF